MSTYREHNIIKFDNELKAENFTIRETSFKPLKDYEVLVKIHAVSLNFRDLLISKNAYGTKLPDNLVPGSDASGEIVEVWSSLANSILSLIIWQIGDGAQGSWRKGQRVAISFALDYVDGEASAEKGATALGAGINGVLTEYRVVPAHVSRFSFTLILAGLPEFLQSLVEIPEHLSYEEASTLP